MALVDKIRNSVSSGNDGTEEDINNILNAPNSLTKLARFHKEYRSQSPNLWSPNDLIELTDREYEILVATLYAKKGYEVAVTPPTRDGGVDIIAVRDGAAVLIEAKQLTEGRVAVGDVRDLYSVARDIHSVSYDICNRIEYVAEIAIFTTSDLSTDAARRLQRADNQEDFPAWVAKSETTCDLLNIASVNKSRWKDYSETNVTQL